MCNLPVLEMALPFPVMVPISSNVLFGGPFLIIFHIVQSPNWQSAITGTEHDSFCPISGAGLCQFWYGCSLGPVSELDSMRMVPFPVPGSASSGTVVHQARYRNWTLCKWSHFRYRALPVPVRSFIGPRTGTGLYASSSAGVRGEGSASLNFFEHLELSGGQSASLNFCGARRGGRKHFSNFWV